MTNSSNDPSPKVIFVGIEDESNTPCRLICPSTAARSTPRGTPTLRPSLLVQPTTTWCHWPDFQPPTSVRDTVTPSGVWATARSIPHSDFSRRRLLPPTLSVDQRTCRLPSAPSQP